MGELAAARGIATDEIDRAVRWLLNLEFLRLPIDSDGLDEARLKSKGQAPGIARRLDEALQGFCHAEPFLVRVSDCDVLEGAREHLAVDAIVVAR